MLQLDSTTVSATRMSIKFHCMSCLHIYGNEVILSDLLSYLILHLGLAVAIINHNTQSDRLYNNININILQHSANA